MYQPQFVNSYTTPANCRLDYFFLEKLIVLVFKLSPYLNAVCFLLGNSPTSELYTGCNRRNGPDFGRVFLMLNYTDITQNTYIQSSMFTEILAREV